MSFLVTLSMLLHLATLGDLPKGSPTSHAAKTPAAVAPLPGKIEAATKEVVVSGNKASLELRLVEAIKALEFQGLVLSEQKRKDIAAAALATSISTGVDPFFLIALARMESDFVSVARVNYQCKTSPRYICSADCGITQHHVNGPGKWVQSYCTLLQKDFRLTFQKSAEEIVRHVEWCHKHRSNPWWSPLEQCVLNRYNAGPYYRRDSQCQNLGEPGQEASARKELRRRCLIKAAYWKRVLCFYYGAKDGKKLQRSCRYCMNVADIPWFYGEKLVSVYTTPPLFQNLLPKEDPSTAIAAPAVPPSTKPTN